MADSTIGRPDLNRLRVKFGKDGRLAYLGHLEVINTVMRSVRRAQLPFSVGNGFAQRMRIQFSQALPVGAASNCEYYDLYLTERVEPAEALLRLKKSSPDAMAPLSAAYVGGRLPALEAWLTRADWQVRIMGEGLEAVALDTAFRELCAQGKIDFMRGNKPRTISLENTLVGWEAVDVDVRGERAIDLELQTRSSNLGALRPAVLIEAAAALESMSGAAIDSLRVLRTSQWHEEEDGSATMPLAESLLV